jgi:hypothetical protein
MTVTRAAQDTARAALIEPFRIEPFFDSFKTQRFVAVVFHEIDRSQNTLGFNFITRK